MKNLVIALEKNQCMTWKVYTNMDETLCHHYQVPHQVRICALLAKQNEQFVKVERGVDSQDEG